MAYTIMTAFPVTGVRRKARDGTSQTVVPDRDTDPLGIGTYAWSRRSGWVLSAGTVLAAEPLLASRGDGGSDAAAGAQGSEPDAWANLPLGEENPVGSRARNGSGSRARSPSAAFRNHSEVCGARRRKRHEESVSARK